ncbi:DUF6132 family protein [Crocinitomicaceae bacterium]|nr:DUF6132 family protein [Crocinitomicaceae bacterium]MDC1186348.1 DUF6132 family protein [Crocinitomicaceae bacterium]
MNNKSIKSFLLNNLLTFIGIVLGGVIGYVYYKQIGCVSRTCSITSDPFYSILYGSLMGSLLLNIFQNKKK